MAYVAAQGCCIRCANRCLVYLQDGNVVEGEGDEESEREANLLQVELETMKAVEQTQMLQQVSTSALHKSVPSDNGKSSYMLLLLFEVNGNWCTQGEVCTATCLHTLHMYSAATIQCRSYWSLDVLCNTSQYSSAV